MPSQAFSKYKTRLISDVNGLRDLQVRKESRPRVEAARSGIRRMEADVQDTGGYPDLVIQYAQIWARR